MRDAKNIMQVAALRPDYMGFIFYEKSPRYVGRDFSIPEEFPAYISRVGVFVNESTASMVEKATTHKLEYLQLHGHEPAKQCEELKKHGLKIIKVFSMDDDMNFGDTQPYREVVDFFLFDTKGKYYGGNARTFNWSLLKKYDQQIPFFLSGGLTADNVATARELSGMNIHALDLNSGVEKEPAFKDVSKIGIIQAALKIR